VLIDGKRGDGLGILNGLPGQVGPLATSAPEVRNALGWVRSEMIERYDTVVQKRGGRAWNRGEGPTHLVVFFDEFQEYRADDTVTVLLHDLAAMGRSARVHLVAGTQKPTVKMFGSDVGGATRDQFGTRIGHRVSTYQASSAIIGSNAPRADKLLPRGDAYVIGHTDGYPMRDRVQIAYVDEDALYRHTNGGRPQLERWPEFDVETVGSGRGRPRMQFSDRQIAVSIHGARRGYGRPTLQELLEDLGEEIPGSEPAGRLLEKGRRIQEELGRLSG
jgi:DNA segregation ATPase FtsK/SpoIIIE-like protein